jgi:hypothetical protein
LVSNHGKRSALNAGGYSVREKTRSKRAN